MQEGLHLLFSLREYQADLAHGNELSETPSRRASRRRVVGRGNAFGIHLFGSRRMFIKSSILHI